MATFSSADDLPGEPISPWLATTGDDDRSVRTLEGTESVDVAVIGAGIAGLSTAIELRERDLTVAVLERDRIAAGVTGKTTAKLTSQHGLLYAHLRAEFGRRAASQYATAQEEAIDVVEDRIDELEIDCSFERVPSYLYSDTPDEVERETDAAQAAGIDASYVTSVPPFERAQAAVRFDDQAWFHPRRYLLGIADELRDDDGAAVYEHTRVTDVEPGSPCRLEMPGGEVTAEQIVLATGFPILDRAGYFARLHPKRSYVLGLRLEGQPPEGMYYRSGDSYRSVRTHRDDDGDLLLVGGENHKTGQGGSTTDRYRRLLRWARERFPVESVAYRWSTQDYVPADKVPFVGRVGPGAENTYVATGFRGWGMTNGVAAGRLLAGLLAGEQPPARTLFDPLRFTPKSSFASAVTENADAASQFATDWARTLLTPGLTSLEPGEGTVLRKGTRPIACSRAADGKLHVTSAVCTHMACLVEWNDAERSWDCPCHGSRFSPDGDVLEGPATDDLPTRRIK
ncbi:FAD-dependent oxidoreductase [Natronobacterium gregoryi]|uniref:FAD-dependent oxidoreductase n=2 Tax=Natronobacterium gregoryi TaxID=44930 RepID=L0AI81_NATGS|nr:FAD-dependent oxidoreductase [Natronobacterium gregoryi]AFZ73521.1 glycine/D-amino acid oxidase, deaminating [Natronobacterium gregoryi SP2]ELY68377.1 FAD dependent oxidoreductase [Natronobacterium gregoryi SP2]PLK20576.1 FAD-dependent oxidoreductase [Natronobacterium gregoryi SP2]SFJ16805.1 Glycine/D-amino acid oxidase [Natronobacterium gregoryi]